ncbi:MAG TPA: YqgE/AlgH family protein [Myxococcota bacterium]|nr:YqgE/AlgH family protein [Myxococcota bacterium]
MTRETQGCLKAALLAAVVVAVGTAWALTPLQYPLIGTGSTIPPVDEPCLDERILGRAGIGEPFEDRVVRICIHAPDYGTVGFMETEGPVGQGEVFVLYRDEAGMRWTNCQLDVPFPAPGWARAPRVPDEAVVAIHSGYAGWHAGQLKAEITAGAWEVLPSED